MANARLGWFSPLGVAFRFGVCRSAGWPSGSRFRFSARTASGLPSASWRFRLPFRGCPRRVGLRAHRFRFSACVTSGLPLGGLAFGLPASAFRHAPLRSYRSASWPSGSRLPLFGTHRFGVALGGLVLLPSASEIATRQVGASAFRFGVAARRVGASAFRFGDCARRVGLWAHDFRFRHAPLRGCHWASWPSGSRFPLFGTHRFGVALGE